MEGKEGGREEGRRGVRKGGSKEERKTLDKIIFAL